MNPQSYQAELRYADQICDAAANEAALAIREADAAIHDFLETDEVTEDEVNELRNLVLNRGPTPEWQRVISRIESGDFSWGDLASGKLALDPDVRAAYDSLRALSAINETHGESREQQSGSIEDPLEDEDYFDNFDPFRSAN